LAHPPAALAAHDAAAIAIKVFLFIADTADDFRAPAHERRPQLGRFDVKLLQLTLPMLLRSRETAGASS